MIRRREQTVRFPVARMAPTARNWALTQVRLENSGAKAATEAIISGGRSTAVVSRGDGSSTTVDPGQRPPGSASQLGQSRVAIVRQACGLGLAEPKFASYEGKPAVFYFAEYADSPAHPKG